MKAKDKRNKDKKENKISRKEAISKGSKLAILTAASMMIVLPSKEAAAQSPGPASPPTRW